MKKDIEHIFIESIRVKEAAYNTNKDKILDAIKLMTTALKAKRKLLFFGNGGSAADSQHIAAEFIGRFQKERRALPAIALTTDTSILTALSNDYGYDTVFARQIAGLGRKGDIAVGISTSGNSPNVLKGIQAAKKMGLKTVSFTGGNGGKLAKMTDISLIVPSKITARIQESHLVMAHAICEMVENQF